MLFLKHQDLHKGPNDMIVTYNIIANFTTRRYRSTDQRYCCAATSRFWNRSVTHMYRILKIIWVDLCANIEWINVNVSCWFICICTRTMCATRPATIISSPIGKLSVKPDHQRRYRDIVTDFHTMLIQKNPMIPGLGETNCSAPLLLAASRAYSIGDWCFSGCLSSNFLQIAAAEVFLQFSWNLSHVFYVPICTKLYNGFS